MKRCLTALLSSSFVRYCKQTVNGKTLIITFEKCDVQLADGWRSDASRVYWCCLFWKWRNQGLLLWVRVGSNKGVSLFVHSSGTSLSPRPLGPQLLLSRVIALPQGNGSQTTSQWFVFFLCCIPPKCSMRINWWLSNKGNLRWEWGESLILQGVGYLLQTALQSGCERWSDGVFSSAVLAYLHLLYIYIWIID